MTLAIHDIERIELTSTVRHERPDGGTFYYRDLMIRSVDGEVRLALFARTATELDRLQIVTRPDGHEVDRELVAEVSDVP